MLDNIILVNFAASFVTTQGRLWIMLVTGGASSDILNLLYEEVYSP